MNSARMCSRARLPLVRLRWAIEPKHVSRWRGGFAFFRSKWERWGAATYCVTDGNPSEGSLSEMPCKSKRLKGLDAAERMWLSNGTDFIVVFLSQSERSYRKRAPAGPAFILAHKLRAKATTNQRFARFALFSQRSENACKRAYCHKFPAAPIPRNKALYVAEK